MGIVMSAFSMASVAGVPIGLWIANTYNWNAAFYFILIIGILLWFISFLFLPSMKPKGEDSPKSLIQFKTIISQKLYLQSFLLTGCLALGIFMIIPFIGPYLVNNVGLLETDLPYVYLVGGSGTIITARIVGKLSDRFGCFKVFRSVIYISILPILCLTGLQPMKFGFVLIVTSLFTMFASTRLIPAMTLISGVVAPKERGAFMSLENSGRHLSSGLASQIGGLIIGTTSDGKLTNYLIIGIICVALSFVAISIAKVIDLNLKLKSKII
jgi:predicted MFS family arabinose efflux permease